MPYKRPYFASIEEERFYDATTKAELFKLLRDYVVLFVSGEIDGYLDDWEEDPSEWLEDAELRKRFAV